MNCKNCNESLPEGAKFCQECGAKVVEERTTLKGLFSEITNAVGWDSKYFVTVRTLLTHPERVLSTYLGGTRKRYMNPFGFFAIGIAISLFFFAAYQDELFKGMEKFRKSSYEFGHKLNDEGKDPTPQKSDIPYSETTERYMTRLGHFQESIYKNYNLSSFVLLPLFALISFLVFLKPYNYAEHIIINAYIQGVTFLFSSLCILLAIIFDTFLYQLSILLVVVYYMYAFGKLYSLSLKTGVLKLLRFIVVLIPIYVVISIIVSIIVFLSVLLW